MDNHFNMSEFKGSGLVIGKRESGKTTVINNISKAHSDLSVYDDTPIIDNKSNFITAVSNLSRISKDELSNINYVFVCPSNNQLLTNLYNKLLSVYPELSSIDLNVFTENYNKYINNQTNSMVIDIQKLKCQNENIANAFSVLSCSG